MPPPASSSHMHPHSHPPPPQGSGSAIVAARAIVKGEQQQNSIAAEPNNINVSNSVIPGSSSSVTDAAPVIISPRTGKPKRRKATRACIHCQRTHLTCDNNRPCERCVARGLADTCRDGVRKKAKYLADVPEAVANSEEALKFDPRYNIKPATGKRKAGATLPTSVSASSDARSTKNRRLENLQPQSQLQSQSQPLEVPRTNLSGPISQSLNTGTGRADPENISDTKINNIHNNPLANIPLSSSSTSSSSFGDISLLKPISFTDPKVPQQTLDTSSDQNKQQSGSPSEPQQNASSNLGLSINTASTSPFNSLLAPMEQQQQQQQQPQPQHMSSQTSQSQQSQHSAQILGDSPADPILLMTASTPSSSNTSGPGINTSSLAGLADAAASHDLVDNHNNNNQDSSNATHNMQNSNNQQQSSVVNLNDPNTWLYNLRPSRHNFQSMAVNMEYSIISNIINNTPYGSEIGPASVVPPNGAAATAAAAGVTGNSSAYSPSLSSTGGDSPSLGKPNSDIYGTPTNPGSTGSTSSHPGIGGASHSNHYGHGSSNSFSGGNSGNGGGGYSFNPQTSGVFHLNNLSQYALGLTYSVPSSISSANGGSSSDTVQNLPEILDLIDRLKQAKHDKKITANPFWAEQQEALPGPKRFLSFTISTKPITPYNTPVASSDITSPPMSLPLVQPQQGSLSSSSGPNGSIAPSDEGMIFRKYSEPADIYANVRQPYSYTPAYHQLTLYIRTRFTREQQMHIARCMASYRPSFIACTNTLKEDDLIFMEQCFQRTLLEYEKFISYSGTPTVVWRRTGQVAAVGKEFCMLTGWPRERLLNEHTFIVELMDDKSVLEYFEMFSKMAFGDSRGANMTECTLLTPQGKNIKTSSTWTLKRDVFGIPMMIVGNFLPVLN